MERAHDRSGRHRITKKAGWGHPAFVKISGPPSVRQTSAEELLRLRGRNDVGRSSANHISIRPVHIGGGLQDAAESEGDVAAAKGGTQSRGGIPRPQPGTARSGTGSGGGIINEEAPGFARGEEHPGAAPPTLPIKTGQPPEAAL